eukprot:scaffold290836_cov44-Prasinocladus_malaysianus.AAC.1
MDAQNMPYHEEIEERVRAAFSTMMLPVTMNVDKNYGRPSCLLGIYPSSAVESCLLRFVRFADANLMH